MIEFLIMCLVVFAGWAFLEIREINNRLRILGEVINNYYDAKELCELTAELVLDSPPRIKRRPRPTVLTVVKGPKQ